MVSRFRASERMIRRGTHVAVATIGARRSVASARLWREISRQRMAYLFLMPALLVLLFVDFIPMIQGAGTSLWAYNIFRPGVRPFVGLRFYVDLLNDEVFVRSFWQSWYFTLGSVACQFALGLVVAILLNQSVRFRASFRAVVLIPWVVPSSLAAMMFGLLFTSTGLVNTMLHNLGLTQVGLVPDGFAWLSDARTAMPTIIFTNMWKGFPFFAVMLLAAMQAIPQDLYEAARVDGATSLRAFWHVTLPGIRPTILIATLLGVIWTFNSIDLIYILTYGGPYYATFTLAMFSYQQAFGLGLVGYASAVAVFILALMAVVTAIYLLLYRRVVEAL
jgi:multiple sugar transport system permease protein